MMRLMQSFHTRARRRRNARGPVDIWRRPSGPTAPRSGNMSFSHRPARHPTRRMKCNSGRSQFLLLQPSLVQGMCILLHPVPLVAKPFAIVQLGLLVQITITLAPTILEKSVTRMVAEATARERCCHGRPSDRWRPAGAPMLSRVRSQRHTCVARPNRHHRKRDRRRR
jgi:hypothetical protein